MTTMTPAPATTGDPDPYYAGRGDAYDDSATLTLDQLNVRAALHAEYHPALMYVLGYQDRIIELRFELAAVKAAETELAHVDLLADAL
ncbi:hypothetical protein HY68_36695 [Streptomyces sp. AcH 505]|uniref:hypothetical protein n=1 Tax=Streptomyces sp. AcH 505 TaxID=352211 RepID=UPI000591CE07|nr:hypothetical protein HY68_36695 [Streptomyces sp. AcH 505]